MMLKMLCFIFLFVTYRFDIVNAFNFDLNSEIFNVSSSEIMVFEYEDNSLHRLKYNDMNGGVHQILTNDGEMINDSMYFPSVSNDGKFIVFTSRASNITDDKLKTCHDIINKIDRICNNVYLYNVEKKKSVLIKDKDKLLNGDSYVAIISGDGKSVIFETIATNLVDNKYDCTFINGVSNCINIYKYDILTNKMFLISTKSNFHGTNGNAVFPSISDDGRYITFQTNADNLIDEPEKSKECYNYATNKEETCVNVFLFDSFKNKLDVISKHNELFFNDTSGNALITNDGKYVIFESYATNVFDNDGVNHIYAYDVNRKDVKLISSQGDILNNRDNFLLDVSDDSGYVAYKTRSTNLDGYGGVFVYSLNSDKTSRVEEINDVTLCDFWKENILFVYDDKKELSKIYVDKKGPNIEIESEIYITLDNIETLSNKITVEDNLCGKEHVYLNIDGLNDIISEGVYSLRVSATDIFGNISSQDIIVNVFSKDIDPPDFNDINEIFVERGCTDFKLSMYVEAFDKIDGRTKIYIISDGGLNLKELGEYTVKLMTKDRSNNVAYKSIKVIVHEIYNVKFFLHMLIGLAVIFIIIFLIIKVK